MKNMKKFAFLFVAALALAACGGSDDEEIGGGGNGGNGGDKGATGIDYSESETFQLVDMGTSVLWANMNLGAETAYDKGDFYQWANLSGTIKDDANKTIAACRVPSEEEWKELWNVCGQVKVQGIHPYGKYGVVKGQSGYLFRSGITGNVIFFPFAGYDTGGAGTYFINKKGCYWTSTYSGNNGYNDIACCYTFAEGGMVVEEASANYGLSVRVVSTK